MDFGMVKKTKDGIIILILNLCIACGDDWNANDINELQTNLKYCGKLARTP